MAKNVIEGTKQLRQQQAQVVKGHPDARKLRCMKCKTVLAVAVPDGKGGTITTCPNCKRQYTSTQI